MNYLTTENGTPEPINLRSWVKSKAKEAGQSWPEIWNAADDARGAFLAERGVYPYTIDAKPSFDPVTQRLVDGGFSQDAQGNWTRGWVVEAITEAERAADAQAEADRFDNASNMVDQLKAVIDLIQIVDDRNRANQSQLTEQQMRQGLKNRILFYARQRRGL